MIEKLEVGHSCHFEAHEWVEGGYTTMTLEYVEHSSDHWHSDSTTEIDIDLEKAQEIVNFLCKHFKIQPTPA